MVGMAGGETFKLNVGGPPACSGRSQGGDLFWAGTNGELPKSPG